MIQKSRLRLFAVGALMAASIAFVAASPYFWAAGIVLAVTGMDLMVWATIRHGRWCRNCKRFRVSFTRRADA